MRRFIAVLGVFGALTVSSVGVAAAAPAQPSVSAAAAAPAQPHFCSILVGPAAAGKASPVLAQGCSESSQADADRAMRSSAPRALAVQANTNIMIWYDLVNLQGNSTVIYGSSGPCDGAGYRIVPNTYWENHISSIARQQTCDIARITNFALNQSATFGLTANGIGAFDNNVGLVQVYSTYAR